MVDVEGAAAREQPPEHDAKLGRLCLQPTGDRGFESCSLQRGVSCEPDSQELGFKRLVLPAGTGSGVGVPAAAGVGHNDGHEAKVGGVAHGRLYPDLERDADERDSGHPAIAKRCRERRSLESGHPILSNTASRGLGWSSGTIPKPGLSRRNRGFTFVGSSVRCHAMAVLYAITPISSRPDRSRPSYPRFVVRGGPCASASSQRVHCATAVILVILLRTRETVLAPLR
jgi:hypothetical protein